MFRVSQKRGIISRNVFKAIEKNCKSSKFESLSDTGCYAVARAFCVVAKALLGIYYNDPDGC